MRKKGKNHNKTKLLPPEMNEATGSCFRKTRFMYANACGGSLIGIRAMLLLPILLLAGCGDSGPVKYQVQGTVTYDEKPVPTGGVIFLSQDGKQTSAAIGTDGRYQTELPVGKYYVGVSAPRTSNQTGMEAFDAAPQEPYVPHHFAVPKNSGLSATVEENDENQIDFPLKKLKRRKRR